MPDQSALTTSQNGVQALNTIADALNDTIVRSEAISPYCLEVCKSAAAAMTRCRERHLRTGRYGFDGPAMQEIAAALDLFDEILANSTPAQMIAAGQDGQILYIVNVGANAITLNANGMKYGNAGAAPTLNQDSTITFMYSVTRAVWEEIAVVL